jgi:membrane-associated phospholipid phosphatase
LRQRVGSSRQQNGNGLERKTERLPYLIWLVSLLICTLAIAVVFRYFDVWIARRVHGFLPSTHSLATGLAGAVLISIEAAVALVLILVRIMRGHLWPLGEATLLACLASICAYAFGDSALKLLFGVPNPTAVMHGAHHAFHLLKGSSGSSFPSGHMVLSGAFAGVFMRLYRRSIVPLSVLLLIAALLLILGDWHFVSDVIAGTFAGISAGLLAGEVWVAHSR